MGKVQYAGRRLHADDLRLIQAQQQLPLPRKQLFSCG